jgi:hypothetical protein
MSWGHIPRHKPKKQREKKPPPIDKVKAREELERQMNEFLANGKTVVTQPILKRDIVGLTEKQLKQLSVLERVP